MTTLKLKYTASIIIILIHFYGYQKSWDHKIQEDFVNLLRINNYVNLEDEPFDNEHQTSKWEDSEIEVYLLNTFLIGEASNSEGGQVKAKFPIDIGYDLISTFDPMTKHYQDKRVQYELHL